MPVPERGSLLGELVALLTTARLPFTAPTAVGEKSTFRLVFCPAGRVYGKLRPVTLYPDPVTGIWEIVTLAVPVLVMMTGNDGSELSITLPKAVLLGLRLICRVTAAPEIATV